MVKSGTNLIWDIIYEAHFFITHKALAVVYRAFCEYQAYMGLCIYFFMASVAGYGLDYDLTGRDRGTD